MTVSRKNVFSNVLWRFAERIGAQLVQFIVSIVLARMLAPDVYGVVALITIFITILQVFIDNGLGNALIQKKDADELDFSTVFYTNVVFCVVLYLLLFFCAPLLADFYNNEELIPLIRVLGVTILVSGLKNVQQAYVSRKLMFRKFFFATLAGTLGAAFVGIVLAYKGAGAWALVAQQLFNVVVDTIVLWAIVKWRPTKQFSFSRLKVLFGFGWKLLMSAMIETVYSNVRQLIIGKMYSEESLAFYNRGKQFPSLIMGNINTSIDSVLFPSMSSVQEKTELVKKMTKRAIKTSTFVMAPLMMGMAFAADNVISVVLTEKWLPSAPYLCIFSIYFVFWPIHTANLNAINAVGRSDIYLRLEIIKKIVGVLTLALTVPFGPFVIALGMLVENAVCQIINSWPNKKLLGYGYVEQLKDIIVTLVLAVFMGVCVYGVDFIGLPAMPTLFLQAPVGASVYIVGAKILKIDSYEYTKSLLGSLIRKEKNEKV